MEQRKPPPSGVLSYLGLLLALVFGAISWWDGLGQTASVPEVELAELAAQPELRWQTTVRLVGSVRWVDEHGYRLVDWGGVEVQVLSSRPPRFSEEVLVTAMVGQNPGNTREPLLLELHRVGLRRSLVSVLLALLFVLGIGGLGALLIVRADGKSSERENDFPGDRPEGQLQPELLLTALHGPDLGSRYDCTTASTQIGRGIEQGSDITLADPSVSRIQARIEWLEGSYQLVHLSETNPTRLNGRNVQRARLKCGDRIVFGNTLLQVTLLPRPKSDHTAP